MTSQVPIVQKRDIFRGRTKNPSAERKQTDDHLFGHENWARMGAEGEGLTCGFPPKWMSADGLTLWSVFSVYGEGGKKGVNAHDRFNMVKATLKPAS
jgi:hypothetical protein